MDHETRERLFEPVGVATVARLRLSVQHLWTLLPLFAVAWLGFLRPIGRDFWWHLKVGQIIVQTRQIPSVDALSFTYTGQPFAYVQYWLSEVSYYLMLRVGGLPLVIALNSLLLVLCTWLILRLCLEATHSTRLAALCSLVTVLLVMSLYSLVRPQLYSIVLFTVFYWILWRYRDGRRDLLWCLPALMVLWVNLHGAFFLGIALLGLVWGCEALRRMLHGPRQDVLEPAALVKLGLVLVLTALACLLNPAGLRTLDLVSQLQASPAVRLFVTEWQVPNIGDPAALLVYYGPLFVAVCVFFYSPRRLNLTELVLFLAFALLGLTALRNGVWFTLMVTPMVARHLVELRELLRRPRWAWSERLRTRAATRGAVTHDWPAWFILTCLAAITVLLSPWVRPLLGIDRLGAQLVDKGTPVGAMDYMAAQHLLGNTFHPEECGDYLIWRLWPQQRSFIDGRIHLFGEAFVRDYLQTFSDPDWETRLARYDIRYLLLPKTDAHSAFLLSSARQSAHWVLMYEDDVSVLFEKRS